MPIKQENEITIRILCSKEELIKHLEEKGLKKGRKFRLNDHYLIPKKLKIEELTVREILSKAVIIRNIDNDGKSVNKITFKNRNINEKGEIVSQTATSCEVLDYTEGIRLFEELGYYEIMNIIEDDIIYYNDKIELAIKDVYNGDLFIETETNKNIQTIEELKKMIESLEIPFEKDNYFVKKAEETLDKILKEKEC
ncbi:MAG: hypothetical protein HG454_001900 [Clostridiales bacterium]|nr:hypothetical protein [Clostridiales bacterium]